MFEATKPPKITISLVFYAFPANTVTGTLHEQSYKYWQIIWRCQKRTRGPHCKTLGVRAAATQFQLGSRLQENTRDNTAEKQNPNCRQ